MKDLLQNNILITKIPTILAKSNLQKCINSILCMHNDCKICGKFFIQDNISLTSKLGIIHNTLKTESKSGLYN